MSAPNFSGNYPNGGQRIGPLWRELWEHLGERGWISGSHLAEIFAPRHGVAVGTVKTILWAAVKAGHLEQGYRHDGKFNTKRSFYRRPVEP